MSKTSHLYRRGNNLYFRLSVPNRFRAILKVTQFTQSLHTQNRKDAIPASYRLASEAKTLFLRLDTLMSENFTDEELKAVVDEIESGEKSEKIERLTAKLRLVKRQSASKLMSSEIKSRIMIEELESESYAREQSHRKERELVVLKSKADAYDKLSSLTFAAVPTVQQEPITAKVMESNAPLLSVVYQKFLDSYVGKGSTSGESNKKKLGTFGKLFLNFTGDKKIDQLTQKEVNQFFRLLVKCPGGRGGNTDAFNKLSIHERIYSLIAFFTTPSAIFIASHTLP